MAPKRRKQYTQEDMERAFEAVINDNMPCYRAATHFNVPASTLWDKVNNKSPLVPVPRTILTLDEEAQLCDWLVTSAQRGCRKSRQQLFKKVHSLLKGQDRRTPFTCNKPGKKWLRSFLARHPQLKTRKTAVFGGKRERVTPGKLKAWFYKVETKLAEDGIAISKIDPRCIFSAGETGFPLHSTGKVLLTNACNEPQSVGSDTKKQITVLRCGSAAGDILKPLMIFPEKRWTFQPWLDFPESASTKTDNGWLNPDTWTMWLKEIFIPAVENLPRPLVLFFDGHTSPVNMEVHDICTQHKITYFLLPKQASHIMQPLDLFFHGSLKWEWEKALEDYKAMYRDDNIKTDSFAAVFKDVWQGCYSPGLMVKAFNKTGLHPWDPEAPDYKKCEASLIYGKLNHEEAQSPCSVSEDEDTDQLDTENFEPQVDFFQVEITETPNEESFHPVAPDPQKQLVCNVIEMDTTEAQSSSIPRPFESAHATDTHATNLDCLIETKSNAHAGPQVSPETALFLDKLIDHIIETKWTAYDIFWVRKRQMLNIKPKEGETSYKKYLELYSKIVPTLTFDNLPVPHGWTDKTTTKSTTKQQASTCVAGEKYEAFEISRAQNKKTKNDKNKEESNKKTQNATGTENIRERSKSIINAQRLSIKKKIARRKGKCLAGNSKLEHKIEEQSAQEQGVNFLTAQEEETEHDEVSQEQVVEVYTMNNHDMEKEAMEKLEVQNQTGHESEVTGDKSHQQRVKKQNAHVKKEHQKERVIRQEQKNTPMPIDSGDTGTMTMSDFTGCHVCHRKEELSGWIECDKCTHWYHKHCTGSKKYLLLEMGDEEMESYKFVCVVCQRNRR